MAIEHAVIPDAQLHEPKGVIGASADEVYIADGLGSGTWGSIADAVYPITDTYWNHEWAPACRMRLPGAVADPGVDTDGNTLLFDAATNEIIYEHFALPRDRLDGTDLRFYVYWTKTTSAAGNVAWDLDYKINTAGGVIGGTWQALGSLETTPVNSDSDTADQVLYTALDFLDSTSLTNGDTIQLRLTRNAADALDTYAADARVLGIKMTYNIANPGTALEFT